MRTLALDVHARFAEVALHEEGEIRRVGQVATRDLPAFAESLAPEDHVVIESTSISWAIVDLIAKHAGRVTISNPMQTKAIAQAKVKTDKVDAKVLAQLGAADFLAEVWVPDQGTRALRRRCAQRQALVRERTAHRVRIHAILQRNLVELPVTDVFGRKGRRLLAAARLPEHEREQVDAGLRLRDAIEAEIDEVERRLAREALASTDVRRLMTIPGVGPMTALGLVGVIGDVGRFPSHRHLVGYLGLDPKVRQSGEREARTGHISRQGQAHARALLCEAANAAVRVPGPLRAFFERLRSRRGFGVGRYRAQARGDRLAHAHAGRGLPLRSVEPHPDQAPGARARPKPRAPGPGFRATRSARRSSDGCSNRPRAPTASWSPLARRARGPTGDALPQAMRRPTTRGRLKVPKRLLFSSGVARAGTDLRRPSLTFLTARVPGHGR
jgi:transposase